MGEKVTNSPETVTKSPKHWGLQMLAALTFYGAVIVIAYAAYIDWLPTAMTVFGMTALHAALTLYKALR